MAADNRVMAAEVEAKGASFQVGVVKPLFTAFPVSSAAPFDVSADGTRFAIVTVQQEQSSPITLVVNWPAGVKQ